MIKEITANITEIKHNIFLKEEELKNINISGFTIH